MLSLLIRMCFDFVVRGGVVLSNVGHGVISLQSNSFPTLAIENFPPFHDKCHMRCISCQNALSKQKSKLKRFGILGFPFSIVGIH